MPPEPKKQFAESPSELIERVTVLNDDSGFSVINVKAKGHRDPVAVVGSLPSVRAGEWVTAEARWIQDREFGLLCKAEILGSTAPTGREGIEKHLGSGMSKGIGPVGAKKLGALIGQRKALGIDVKNNRTQNCFSGLLKRLNEWMRPVLRASG